MKRGYDFLKKAGVYYLATVVMPYLMRQLVAFLRHMTARIPLFIERVKEGCNRL